MNSRFLNRQQLLSLIPVLLAGSCFATPFAVRAEALPTVALPTVTVAPHTVAVGFYADALVEAVQQATVAAQVAGRVVEMKIDAGQAVKKGELLMRIDAREAAEATNAARSQLQTVEASYERTKNLRAQNFVSQAGLDKARAEYDAAKAAAAQAGVGLGYASVTAPITGIVAQRHVEEGEMASPGRPLATIFDPAGLRVVASVPQYILATVRGVREARVEFPELGRAVAASAVMVLPTADAATHVSQVRVMLPPGNDGLVPGMAARVHFVTGQATKMTVPLKAVIHRGEMTAVYVESGKGLALRQLRLGENVMGSVAASAVASAGSSVGDSEIEVLAGLVAGERVVLDPVRAGIVLQQGKQ